MSNTSKSLIEISEKMDKVIKLLAFQAVKDIQKESEKIELLNDAGFSSAEIGKALNKSTANVCVVLKQIKEKAEKKAPKPQEDNNQEITSP